MSQPVIRRGFDEVDATESNLGVAGMRVEGTDNRIYQLVQAGASFASNASDSALLVIKDTDTASATLRVTKPYTVIPTEAAAFQDPLAGLKVATASVASSAYFWIVVDGQAEVADAAFGSDVSMQTYAQCHLNSDGLLAAMIGVATTVDPAVMVGQYRHSVSRDSDDTFTGLFYVKGGL